MERFETSKTASVLKSIETNRVFKKNALFNETNITIYNVFVKLSFSSKGQNKSKLQKQIRWKEKIFKI